MLARIENNRPIEAFAMFVDINSFTRIVALSDGNNIAQFIRDILIGGVEGVQKYNGVVVGFAGDAFLAIFDDFDDVYMACVSIAKDLHGMRKYISSNSLAFPHCPNGPELKIGIEYGWIDVSDITSAFSGKQKIFIGSTINYASRIASAGKGNRCVVGPTAMAKGLNQWIHTGPFKTKGKKGEPLYEYYLLNFDEVWGDHLD